MKSSESEKPLISIERHGEYVHPAGRSVDSEDRKLRFAYLTRGIHGAGGVATDTAHLLWDSMVSRAAESGIHITAVIGDHTGKGLDNFMFDLINDGEYDGILTWIGQSDEDICRVFSRFRRTPLVSLSSPLLGFPMVGINNSTGMNELMEHLIQDHGVRKIAFICGPDYHAYAVERKNAYISALERAGITPDPKLISGRGEWSKQTGKDGAHLLLDERGLKPGRDIEAIVCANDRIAIGVLEELELRGQYCPADILVCGFNDLPEARSHFPSITSVGMPFHEQGAAAVSLLEELVRNGRCSASVSIPSRLQIHETCGCPVFWERSRTENPSDLELWYTRMNGILQAGINSGDKSEQIHECMQDFLRQIYSFTDISLRKKELVRMDSVLLAESLQKLDTLLARSSSINAVVTALQEEFPKFSVQKCFVVLFSGSDSDSQLPEKAMQVFGFSEGMDPVTEVRTFRTSEIIPGGLRQLTQDMPYIVVPLSFGLERLGYVLYSYGSSDPHVYDSLSAKLSGAFRNAGLSEKLQKKAVDLEATNQQLENSLQTLELAQEKLVEAEKMAALGELVAGIAHEVNTPLGAAITACSFLQDEAAENELVAESSRIIIDNLVRARDLIRNFRQIAADRGYEEVRIFNMHEYLKMIVESMKPVLREGAHEVEICCPLELEVYGYPGAIGQIISNLIQNSVLHGFETRQSGKIRIAVETVVGDSIPEFMITYSDNGCGVREEDRKKIFNPFFTSKRGSGSTGLGLHIVYNLVSQVLGGKISCDFPGEGSAAEAGICFRIQAPISVREEIAP
ncbi:substrate-binding domain-containing protein [Spirochaeta dissipatitropha]